VVKLGVFGVALPNTPAVSSTGDIRFLPTMETVRREAARLRREGADLVVCCTHTDRKETTRSSARASSTCCSPATTTTSPSPMTGARVMVESSEEGYYVTAVDLTLFGVDGGGQHAHGAVAAELPGQRFRRRSRRIPRRSPS
jgi:5'-nucleotidase/UDP-sugar diphosphatase